MIVYGVCINSIVEWVNVHGEKGEEKGRRIWNGGYFYVCDTFMLCMQLVWLMFGTVDSDGSVVDGSVVDGSVGIW